DDTLAQLEREVDLVRRPLQDASLNHQLQDFADIYHRPDVVHAGGHTVNYYCFLAGVRRRASRPSFCITLSTQFRMASCASGLSSPGRLPLPTARWGAQPLTN